MYLPINPILVQIGPLAIHWYGIIMVAAIFLSTMVASRYTARQGEDANNIWDMLLWVLIPAIIGARLYFVFIQTPRGPNGLDSYLANPIKIVQIWNGGIHIYGAFIFGGIALLLYLRQHKLSPLLYLDGVGLGLLLGQAIGRLGNFVNQELYGPPTTLPWGLRIDDAHRIPPYDNLAAYPESVRFQPLFLYEMLWDALGFAVLFWISRRFQKRLCTGDLFCMYLIWAPLGRFLIEFMRTDSWFFPGTPFNTVHIITACAVIGGAVALFIRHRPQPVAVLDQQTAMANNENETTLVATNDPATDTTNSTEADTTLAEANVTDNPDKPEETTTVDTTNGLDETNITSATNGLDETNTTSATNGLDETNITSASDVPDEAATVGTVDGQTQKEAPATDAHNVVAEDADGHPVEIEG